MEKQLFTWEEWDGEEGKFMQFTSCTLLREIGGLPEGATIPMICVDFENGRLFLCDADGESYYGCKLLLELGDDLINENGEIEI